MILQYFDSLPVKKKLFFVSVLSSLLSAGGIISVHYIMKLMKIRKMKEEIVEINWNEWVVEQPDSNQQEFLIQEQLSRNIAFLGEEGVEKLRNSFVIVVGLGGVGSHTVFLILFRHICWLERV
jgi:hypothetical protein